MNGCHPFKHLNEKGGMKVMVVDELCESRLRKMSVLKVMNIRRYKFEKLQQEIVSVEYLGNCVRKKRIMKCMDHAKDKCSKM